MNGLWVPEHGKPGEARGGRHRPRAGQPRSELTSAVMAARVAWLPWLGLPGQLGEQARLWVAVCPQCRLRPQEGPFPLPHCPVSLRSCSSSFFTKDLLCASQSPGHMSELGARCTQFYGRWALPSEGGTAPSPGATWPHPPLPGPRPPGALAWALRWGGARASL